ncbi:hypothetical protein [Candidatus Palauibacter sp.]|uniref:hypothetical protein n=1 Tax=Candidatus Palauibacter sp. TaxID=3101350 RepID=UPI003B01769E
MRYVYPSVLTLERNGGYTCSAKSRRDSGVPIRRSKARARGYRTTENFITIAYLVCGKLNFKLPT